MEDEREFQEEIKEDIVDVDQYLANGVHIGTRQKTGAMSPFIYRVRADGLFVLDVQKTNERVQLAARLIAYYDPENVFVVSARQYGHDPVKKFGEVTGVRTCAGRFTPGSLTNPLLEGYIEPELLVITDPLADAQPLSEAAKIGLSVIGLCDTDNETKYIDLIIPTNNRGRKALTMVYWLLSQCVLRERGELSSHEFEVPLEEFESDFEEE